MSATDDRFRAVLISIISSYHEQPEEGADMILRLLPETQSAEAAPEPPEKRTVAPSNPRRRAPRSPPAIPADGRQLTPFEWYTIGEMGNYLGLKSQMVRNVLRENPDMVTRKLPSGQLEIQGRGIISLRHRREKLAEASNAAALQGATDS